LAGTYQRGKIAEATDRLIQLQKAIAAIDAAIVDEKALAPKSITPKKSTPNNPYSKIEDEPGG
jgi:hypothetical protein